MRNKVPRDKKLESVLLQAQGVKQQEVAEFLGISRSSVQRAKSRQRNTGDVEGGELKRGRKPILSQGMEDVSPPFSSLNKGLTVAPGSDGSARPFCLFIRAFRHHV